jgi:DNA-binding transcriptional ArsR family regulator
MTYASSLAALSDPTRRQVFEHLRNGPRSVGELAAEMPVSRPAVSQHLKVLKDAGLGTDQAQGARRVYRIDQNGLGELRSWLDQFWGDALQAFKAHIDDNKDMAHVSITRPDHTRRTRTQKRPGKRQRRPRI